MEKNLKKTRGVGITHKYDTLHYVVQCWHQLEWNFGLFIKHYVQVQGNNREFTELQ